MALTSTTFLEPALDELWFHVGSFEPLISCLPVDLLKLDNCNEENGMLSLRRPLESADIARYITFYAPRIRQMDLDFDPEKPQRCLTIGVLQALQLATNHQYGALSPSLQRFAWPTQFAVRQTYDNESSDSLFPLLSLFIPDNLASLELWSSDFALSGLSSLTSLHSTTRRLTSVKCLDIGGNDKPDVDRDLYLTSFAWDGLEEVAVGQYSVEAIVHIASLPRLHTLEINVLGQLPAFAGRPNLNFFPSLQVLKSTCGSLVCARDLLQYLPPNNQVHTLALIGVFSNDRDEYEDPIFLVGQYCNPLSLKRLELRDMNHGYNRSFVYSDDLEVQEPYNLDPLYGFRKLVHLEINISGGIRVAPSDIQKIRDSWPEIQFLDVRSSTSISDRLPLLSHRHVLELLSQVPSIRTLGLRFDATNISEEEPVPERPPLLNKLCVGETPLCSPQRVLNFLRQQLPKLRNLETHYGLTSRGAMLKEDHIMNKRWAVVIRKWKEQVLA